MKVISLFPRKPMKQNKDYYKCKYCKRDAAFIIWASSTRRLFYCLICNGAVSQHKNRYYPLTGYFAKPRYRGFTYRPQTKYLQAQAKILRDRTLADKRSWYNYYMEVPYNIANEIMNLSPDEEEKFVKEYNKAVRKLNSERKYNRRITKWQR